MSIVEDTRWKSDVNALEGYEDISTTAAMGKIANDANGGKQMPLIHSGDKSYDDLIAEYNTVAANKGGVVHLAADALEGLEAAGAVELGLGGAALPVIALGAGVYELAEANARGKELNTARERDEAHVAMLSNLALPSEFRTTELAKYSHAGTTFQSMNQQMTSHIHGEDHALMALVQLHCDQGMTAAREGGGSMSAPIAKRYAEDPAFKAGYDAMSWAQKKGGATLDSLTKDLDSRDARYGAAGVSWRM